MNYTLKKLSFFLLLMATHNLYAAKLKDETMFPLAGAAPIVRMDYTANYHQKSVTYQIDAEGFHNIDLPDERKEAEKEGQRPIYGTEMGMGKIAQKATYKKCLFEEGLFNQKGQRITHAFVYHIIQTQPTDIAATFIQQLKKSLAIYLYNPTANALICPKCYYLNTLLSDDKQVKMHRKESKARSFALSMPQLTSQSSNNMRLDKRQDSLGKSKQLLANNTQARPQLNRKKNKLKALPEDLSWQNLSGYDLTGCQFTYTDLTQTDLTNVILNNTICDYQKKFLENSKKHRCSGGKWYQENLPKDLKSIANVYPKLSNNEYKAKLLHIASGIACLPLYESSEFYVKVGYWSSELLLLKYKLGAPYGDALFCSLARDLHYDIHRFCWTTQYKGSVNLHEKAPHADFDKYIKDFTDGLRTYGCKSRSNYGFDYYQEQINKSLEGLKNAYPKVRKKEIQVAMCQIGYALSRGYQIQDISFLYYYLFYQNHLILLKKYVCDGIHYQPAATQGGTILKL